MKRVLVCDDDEEILELIRMVLKDKGYLVMTASDDKGIAKKIKSEKPDIIFLDLYFPVGGGEAIAKLVKSDRQLKDIPIIVMSASGDSEQTAKHIRADSFLNKPFDIEEFLRLIKKYAS